MDNSIKITTRFNADGIRQTVSAENAAEAITESLMNLREQEIKRALKELGWIPPEEAEAIKAEALSAPFNSLPGCGDSGCVVRQPKGAATTNGGCQCVRGTTASIIVQRLAAMRDEARRQAEGGE